MGTRTISFTENEYFHVFNRGNSKQNIFLKTSDYERFISLLYLANTSQNFNVREVLKSHADIYDVKRKDTLVKIAAFCLMNNHYHLIISPTAEKGVSRFMQKLATAYSMYFNTKYERTGSLFEGKFKAKHADSDEYLKYLFSYIHLNPITQKDMGGEYIPASNSQHSFNKAKTYPYSTLSDYLTDQSPRQGLGLIDTEIYGMYFKNKKGVQREIFEWLEFEEPALGKA